VLPQDTKCCYFWAHGHETSLGHPCVRLSGSCKERWNWVLLQ